MTPKIEYALHCFRYSFQTLLLRRKLPFIAGMVLNNECNLQCQHCALQQSGKTTSLSLRDIETGLDRLYARGIRSIALTGGEPFLWHDGSHDVNDVIRMIYKKNFLVTSLYTNGTFPIRTLADNVFVSLDGTEPTTNKLRGPVFSKVIKNITNSRHPKIYVNFTINRENAEEIESFCRFAAAVPQIKGIFFYFHTPYYGEDDLLQTRSERIKTAKELLDLKNKYPILNSRAALNDFIQDDWPRPSKVCIVYTDQGNIVDCCRAVDNVQACENCGYLGYLEVIDITRFKYSAVVEALHYLPSGAARRSL